MGSVHRGPVAGLTAQVALLLVLSGSVGLSVYGWCVGLGYGLVMASAVARGMVSGGMVRLGPANRVTLSRAVLVGGVTALAVTSATDGAGVTRVAPVMLALTCVALCLDAVDGWTARRTGSVTALGARFDLEVDAFLIMVLSALVARWAGAWVLLIGAARYLFVVAGWFRVWMRRRLPLRPWRKVVTATQGIVLTTAVVPWGPSWLLVLAVTVAFAMLTESFGRDVWWLWVRRSAALEVPQLEVPRLEPVQPEISQVEPAAAEMVPSDA